MKRLKIISLLMSVMLLFQLIPLPAAASNPSEANSGMQLSETSLTQGAVQAATATSGPLVGSWIKKTIVDDVPANSFEGDFYVVSVDNSQKTATLKLDAITATDSTTISIPESFEIDGYTYTVTEFGRYSPVLKNGSNFTEIILPNSIQIIGNNAFSGSTIGSLEIPASVIQISIGALGDNISNLTINENNQTYSYVGGMLIEGGTSIIDAVNDDLIDSSMIPDTVTTIAYSAFGGSTITDFNIPSQITTLQSEAFARSSLETIIVPDTVTYLGDGVFKDTPNLTSATLSSNITEIPNSTFANFTNAYNGPSKLTEVNFSDKITSIGANAFYGAGITEITLPDTLELIGNSAFARSALMSATIPQSTVYLGSGIFSYSDVKSVVINSPITSIPADMFSGCSMLTSFNVPSTVTAIEYGAFFDSGITSIALPNGLKSIESNAFSMSKLTSIDIPDSVEFIGSLAFAYATDLKSVELPAGLSRLGGETFRFSSITSIEIPSTVTEIGYKPFAYAMELEAITVSADKLTAIDDYSFMITSGGDWEPAPSLEYVYFTIDYSEVLETALTNLDDGVAIYYHPDALGWEAVSTAIEKDLTPPPDPDDPDGPTDPTDPDDPDDPDGPTDPDDPDDPTDPDDPDDPDDPTEPEIPVVKPTVTEDGTLDKETISSEIDKLAEDDKLIIEIPSENKENAKIEGNLVKQAVDKGADKLIIETQDSDARKVEITLDLSTFTGDKIPDINFGISTTVDESFKDSVLEDLDKDEPAVFIDLAHSGDFGGTLEIKLYVGDKFKAGQEVYLYWIDENDSGALKEEKAYTVDADGNILIKITHASVYTILSVQLSAIVDGGTDTNPDSETPQTGDSSNVSFMFTLLILSALALISIVYKKRFQS